MSRPSACGRRALLLGLLIGVLAASSALGARVVGIADIHGDFDAFSRILQTTGLVDENLDWIGADATLVQTGDFLDRGVAIREVVELLMKLQVQAREHGGQAIVLLGNHEGMNVLRITRDVSPDVYPRFADQGSIGRQVAAYSDYVEWRRHRAKRLGLPQPSFGSAEEQAWKAAHPPGYLEYLEAMGPEGWIGSWLRSLPGIVRVGDVVFLHGGISSAAMNTSDDQINQRLWEEMRLFDSCRERLLHDGVIHETTDTFEMAEQGLAELRNMVERLNQRLPAAAAESLRESVEILRNCVNYQDWYLVSDEGPLWFRGFARWSEEEGTEQVARMLEIRRARHFAVGHTPQATARIESRFGNRVFLMDTGMLASFYKGRASALEIDNGGFTAIYGNAREPFALPAVPEPATLRTTALWLSEDGAILPFRSEEEVLGFLLTAEVIERQVVPEGVNKPTKVRLRKDGIEADAIVRAVYTEKIQYRTRDGRLLAKLVDSYRFEVAAYRLSRLLGLDVVPPAVLRKLDGHDVSVQLWVHNVRSEKSRREEGLEPPSKVIWSQQLRLMELFDALIQNVDRNQTNMLIDRDSWKLWLIDHTRSFIISDEIPRLSALGQCERRLWERLQSLPEETLRSALRPALMHWELETLLKRWRQFEAHFAGEIAARGEGSVLFDAEIVHALEPETVGASSGNGEYHFLR